MHSCAICGKTFSERLQWRGHIGGAHARTILKGKSHPNYRTRAEKIDAIKHGTDGGYAAEYRLGIRRCGECKAAHSAAVKKRKTSSRVVGAAGRP